MKAYEDVSVYIEVSMQLNGVELSGSLEAFKMTPEPDLSIIGNLIGDPTRAMILSALMGGIALPASDLAYRAHITPQTASSHLAKLVDGGLIEVAQRGRHRYYRLKNAEVAHALEVLAALSPFPAPRLKHPSEQYQILCFARTCYDHLAGKAGVALTSMFLQMGFLTLGDEVFTLTDQGEHWLEGWEIDVPKLRKERRAFARACLDWSQRQDHLGGALGAAITAKLFEKGWITRLPDTRAVAFTEAGRQGFLREFGLDVHSLETANAPASVLG
jgi:DNA-binding transcriptional ArsR family regulator